MNAEELIVECRRIVERHTKPALPEVTPLIAAYYALPGNLAGGELHVVLDDHNYERKFMRSCIARAERAESRWLGWVLMLLSNSQRRRM